MLVPGIDLEYKQQLSPVAREILNVIDSVPDYTPEMEAADVQYVVPNKLM